MNTAIRRFGVPLIAFLGLLVSVLTDARSDGGLRGTGDLGIVIERASGQVQIIETTSRTRLATVSGLGDLSHASAVFSRDGRYAFVFGRDGGLSKIDLLSVSYDFEPERAGAALRQVACEADLLQVSALTGEGLDAWCAWLRREAEAVRAAAAPGSPADS